MNAQVAQTIKRYYLCIWEIRWPWCCYNDLYPFFFFAPQKEIFKLFLKKKKAKLSQNATRAVWGLVKKKPKFSV